MVLGLGLAFLSPLFQGALANLEATMQTPDEARYFVAEHWVGGLIALGLAHAGLAQSRRGTPRARLLFAFGLGPAPPLHPLVPAPPEALTLFSSFVL